MTTMFAFSFMGLGLPEILVITLIGLLLFGATRLPDLGKSLGKTITSFKEGMSDVTSSETTAKKETTSKVEPEPMQAPQRLTTPTFSTENSKSPNA